MASVETVTHYSHGNNIAQEAAHSIPEKQPAAEWPEHGAIEFRDIVMRYRPGLPFVLKGLSLSIQGGEKIGVVGRCVGLPISDDVLLNFIQNRGGKEFTDVSPVPYRGTDFGLYFR